MKKKFINPEIAIQDIEVEDIIMSSFDENETPWEDEL